MQSWRWPLYSESAVDQCENGSESVLCPILHHFPAVQVWSYVQLRYTFAIEAVKGKSCPSPPFLYSLIAQSPPPYHRSAPFLMAIMQDQSLGHAEETLELLSGEQQQDSMTKSNQGLTSSHTPLLTPTKPHNSCRAAVLPI